MKNHNYKNNYYRLIAEICDFFFLNILVIQKFVEENEKIIELLLMIENMRKDQTEESLKS